MLLLKSTPLIVSLMGSEILFDEHKKRGIIGEHKKGNYISRSLTYLLLKINLEIDVSGPYPAVESAW